MALECQRRRFLLPDLAESPFLLSPSSHILLLPSLSSLDTFIPVLSSARSSTGSLSHASSPLVLLELAFLRLSIVPHPLLSRLVDPSLSLMNLPLCIPGLRVCESERAREPSARRATRSRGLSEICSALVQRVRQMLASCCPRVPPQAVSSNGEVSSSPATTS